MNDLADRRVGAWAMVAGTIMNVGLMLAHPSGVGTMRIGPFDINVVVHAVAVLATPLLVFGAFALTKLIGRPLAGLAFASYAIACAAVVSAATMSGFVMTILAETAHAPGASRTGIEFQSLANLVHWQNQAYANVYTGLAAIAVLLWSISWREALLQRVLGVVIGGGTLAWMLTGTLTLNIHGMLAVTVGLALWMLFAASRMLRSNSGA